MQLKEGGVREADRVFVYRASRSLKDSPLFYRLLYKYARFAFKLFYKRLVIKGSEQIPADKPLIFASNHQNALMDALAMLFAANRPVFFLARADLFNKPFVARILNFLKIMPVFRPRDQVDIVTENKVVFNQVARLLSEGQPMGILPEGTYTPDKRLQTLKKGICRMAFEAAEATGFKMDLHIVPTGLDYSDYHRQGSDLLILFGKPIKVSDYYELYRANPNRALTVLRDTLAESIRELMINIDIPEEYNFIYNYSQEETEKYLRTLKGGVSAHDFIIVRFNKMKEETEKLKLLHRNNQEAYNALKGTRPDLNKKLKRSSSGKMVGLKGNSDSKPGSFRKRFLFGLLSLAAYTLNFLPFALSNYYSGKVKDKQFVGTMKYGTGLVLFPFWYLLLLVVLIPVFGVLPGTVITLIALVMAVLGLSR